MGPRPAVGIPGDAAGASAGPREGVLMLWKLYLIALPVFFAIDMVWLGAVAKGFYRKHLGYLMAPKVGWPAAILFYLLFIAGLVVFAVRPGVLAGSPLKGLLLGAFLGLVSYATYDLTNQATVRD